MCYQAKVVLPSFDLGGKLNDTSASEAAISNSSGSQGFTVTDSTNTKVSSSGECLKCNHFIIFATFVVDLPQIVRKHLLISSQR